MEEEKERSKIWQNAPGTRQAKLLIGDYSRKRSNNYLKLGKSKLRIATGLLTGHCKLRYHLKNMGLETDPSCRKCGEADETSAHILLECEALARSRLLRLGDPWPTTVKIHLLDPQNLLKFLDETHLMEVLQ